MQGTAKTVSQNPFGYNGYFMAKLVGIKPLKSKSGKGIWTVAELDVEVSNSQYPESLFLTDNEDAPDVRACSMLVEAFGGQPILEGATAESIMAALNGCVNKPCAVLMLPTPSKTDPSKLYHKFTDERSVKSVLPVSAVGNKYTGDLPKPGNAPTITPTPTGKPITEADVPF